MIKDDWIKIFAPFIIGWLISGGMGYMTIDMTAYFIATPVILFAVLLVCIKYLSKAETDEIAKETLELKKQEIEEMKKGRGGMSPDW